MSANYLTLIRDIIPNTITKFFNKLNQRYLYSEIYLKLKLVQDIVMRQLLIYDRHNQDRTRLVNRLKVYKEKLQIQEAASISDVFRKLEFGKKRSFADDRNNLLIVCLEAPDMEILDFLGYVHKSKPALPMILYTFESVDWLTKLNVITGRPLIPVGVLVTKQIDEVIRKVLEPENIEA